MKNLKIKFIYRSPNCKLEITSDILFVNKPLFLFIEADKNPRDSMLIRDYSDQIVIDNHLFNFLCCSMNLNNNHFISFFKINNNFMKLMDSKQLTISLNLSHLYNHTIVYLGIFFTQKKLIFFIRFWKLISI